MARWLIFQLLFWSTCIYALRRGDRLERITAGSFIVASLFTVGLGSAFEGRFSSVEAFYLVDAMLFVFLGMVALWSDRFWPLWMAGMQGVTLISHLGGRLAPDVGPWIYGTMVALWSYPMLILLAVVTHQKRKGNTSHAR